MSAPTATIRRPRAAKAALPAQSTTGALPTASTVASVICPAAPRRAAINTAAAHQTHGAMTPLTGPITSVSQLMNGGRNVAKGSAGSFSTMAEYTAYLRGLSVHDLRTHAREDARIVPIDDRERLIKRLETAWTTTATRYPGRPGAAVIPARTPFTREQIEAQAAIRNKLLRQ